MRSATSFPRGSTPKSSRKNIFPKIGRTPGFLLRDRSSYVCSSDLSIGKAFTSVASGIMMHEKRDQFPQGLDTKVFTEKHLPQDRKNTRLFIKRQEFIRVLF